MWLMTRRAVFTRPWRKVTAAVKNADGSIALTVEAGPPPLVCS